MKPPVPVVEAFRGWVQFDSSSPAEITAGEKTKEQQTLTNLCPRAASHSCRILLHHHSGMDLLPYWYRPRPCHLANKVMLISCLKHSGDRLGLMTFWRARGTSVGAPPHMCIHDSSYSCTRKTEIITSLSRGKSLFLHNTITQSLTRDWGEATSTEIKNNRFHIDFLQEEASVVGKFPIQ